MNKRFIVVLLTLGVLLAGMVMPVKADSGNQSGVDELFTDAIDEPGALATAPYMIRQRAVIAHTNVLTGAIDSLLAAESAQADIVLQLFTDTSFNVRLTHLEQTGTGGYVLTGTVDGYTDSSVVMAVEGEALSASISTPDGWYIVQPEEVGIHRIFQATADFGPGENDMLFPPVDAAAMADPADVVIAGDDSGSQIDVLVVYSDDARSKVGGTSQIQSMINTGVANANLAYNNSLVLQDMVLVHTAEVNVDESLYTVTYGSNVVMDWGKVLDKLTNPSDGYLDSVAALRNTVAADLVIFVVNDTAFCGLGWVLSPYGTYFEHYAYSMVSRNCLTGFSLAHETGHNLGGHHNREAAGSGTGAFPYSYGYHDPAPSCKFYTVMSYSMAGCSNTLRIPYFSNPAVYYQGLPTGIDYAAANSADMARTLNNTSTLASNFRDGPAKPVDFAAELTLDHSGVDLSWTDMSVYETGYEVERKVFNSSEWNLVASLPANITGFLDKQSNGLACEETYEYRVRAKSLKEGYSLFSDSVTVSYNCLPPSPSLLTASPQSLSSIVLNWQDNSGTEDGFYLYRSSNGVDWPITPLVEIEADLTSYLDASVGCGTSYYYRILAYNIYGISPQPSNVVKVNTPICVPSAPVSLTAKATSQIRANLTWSPGDTGVCLVDGDWVACKPVKGYRLERQLGTGAWAEVVILPARAITFSDDGLVCNQTYSYRVRAVNESGLSSYSSLATVTSRACAKPPKPAWLRLTDFKFRGQLLTWEEVDGEAGYVLQRSRDGKRWADWMTLGKDQSSVLINKNVLRPPKYYYRIRAFNAYGASVHTVLGTSFTFR